MHFYDFSFTSVAKDRSLMAQTDQNVALRAVRGGEKCLHAVKTVRNRNYDTWRTVKTLFQLKNRAEP